MNSLETKLFRICKSNEENIKDISNKNINSIELINNEIKINYSEENFSKAIVLLKKLKKYKDGVEISFDTNDSISDALLYVSFNNLDGKSFAKDMNVTIVNNKQKLAVLYSKITSKYAIYLIGCEKVNKFDIKIPNEAMNSNLQFFLYYKKNSVNKTFEKDCKGIDSVNYLFTLPYKEVKRIEKIGEINLKNN